MRDHSTIEKPYAAAFFFIRKKDGRLRPVQDYQPINAWTIRNKYPLPLIPQQINRLRGRTQFTKLDIHWGYNAVQVKKGHEWKVAFTTAEELYKPLVMFFRLTNSPATFQAMMNMLFWMLIASGDLTVYMDDMAIHTGRQEGETEEEHIRWHRRIVNEVLTILEENNLYLNIDKCKFEQDHINFLGVRVENNQVKMEEGKVDKVKNWTPPRNLKEVWRFLGFTGYYRYFIKGYSAIAKLLLELTKQSTPWHWNVPQQWAFDNLKEKMCEKPVLQQPDFDKTFYLQTDALAYGVGAILSQEGGLGGTLPNSKPKRHPIAYFSCTFTPTEQNYDIYKWEFLGVVKALENWRQYLIWMKEPFIIETDHKNLTYWKSLKKLSGRTARWYEKLQDYNFRILHIPGKANMPADALSRPNSPEATEPAREVALIPPAAFLNIFGLDSVDSVESRIVESQQHHRRTLEQWAKMLLIQEGEACGRTPKGTDSSSHQTNKWSAKSCGYGMTT
jgi:hypothetical protein